MRIRSALYALAAATLAACNPVVTCTLIGCSSGLVVRFDREPPRPFRLEATVPNDPTPRVIECSAAVCPPPVFEELIAEQVTIRLTTPAGTRVQEFRPRYQDQYPNGRECGSACKQAVVTIAVPG
jgi:hypothetical protein